ncbi:hypothetical protein CRE_09024 [Caenorhabditis remanei]|uniref:G-protein coupled receptors family 1 profile domain-containing protein n=1 Tax=Caenorhabditis remanei TaxID=31234 RepID=E3LIV1_CAERE|nr:hypothetical protein CRE_09024 [Caenorhabditis remanei]
MFSFLLSGQIEVLTICFFRKHKAIMNLANPLRSSSAVYLGIYAMCVLYTCVFATSILISAETREEQLRVMDKLYPSLSANFHALEDFIYFVSNEKMMFCYVLIFGGTLKTLVIINILALRMFKGLKKVKNRLSINTLFLHRVTLRFDFTSYSPVLFFLTAPIAFIPACILAIEIWFPNENSQQITRVAFMCMPTHSVFNSIVVVLTYPEFRKKLYFWKRKSMNTTSVRVSWLRNSNSNAAN